MLQELPSHRGTEAAINEFRREPCGGVPAAVHPSHRLLRHLESIVCTVCGQWARDRVVGLRKVCSGKATLSGKAILSKVARGRPLG